MNHCTECFARLDACGDCCDAIIAEKDKEIAALKKHIAELEEIIRAVFWRIAKEIREVG